MERKEPCTASCLTATRSIVVANLPGCFILVQLEFSWGSAGIQLKDRPGTVAVFLAVTGSPDR